MPDPTRTDAEIHVDATVPLVRITREFDAPPAKVFHAHADPALVLRERLEHLQELGGGRHPATAGRIGLVLGVYHATGLTSTSHDTPPSFAIVSCIRN